MPNVVVSYDIQNDKTRERVRKLLHNYGEPVQYSVFECPQLRPEVFAELKAGLAELVTGELDSVYLYVLCATCLPRLERIPPRRVGFDVTGLIV